LRTGTPPTRLPESPVGWFSKELALSRFLGSLRSKTSVLLQQYSLWVSEGQLVFCCGGVLGNAVATTERDHGEDFAEMHFDRWKERYLRMKARKIDLVENAEGSAGDERD
jgi:hypothetical protein